MSCLFVLSVLTVQLVNPPIGDSTRSPKQEQFRASGREAPIVLAHPPVPDTTLETLLLDRYTAENVASAVESLLTQYPQLRPLLLREILIPTTEEAFLQPLSARIEFSKLVQQMSELSQFGRMSLARKRNRELYQFSAENRVLVPELDVKKTISWIMGEAAHVLK